MLDRNPDSCPKSTFSPPKGRALNCSSGKPLLFKEKEAEAQARDVLGQAHSVSCLRSGSSKARRGLSLGPKFVSWRLCH